MPHTQVMGYAAKTLGEKLTPFQYAAPDLKEHEVRVDVTHCGICHTDIQAIQDYYGITTFPFMPGHEIVGNISAVGPGVGDLKIGERVGIGWQARSCMKCEWCLQGQTQLCMDIVNTTVMVPYGGFSSSVVADHRFAYPLPEEMPSPQAAVLMCAGLTSYAALKPYLSTSPLKVAVVGIGGLGHLAIQFAHALGCEVTAISSCLDKKEQAQAFGADHFICSNDRAAWREFNYHHDLALCTANDGIAWERLFEVMKKRGRVILLGFPDPKFNSTDLVAHELTITGSLIGSPPIMREMLAFASAQKITPMVEVMPMAQVNEALDIVKANKARYRIVLVN